MALRQDIPEGVLFVGEDKKLRFKVTGEDGSTPLDVDGMLFRWVLLDDPESSTPLVAIEEDITVAGTFSEVPATNEQYVEVPVAAEDTEDLFKGKVYHALRRRDVGSRTLLAYGDVQLGARWG